MFRSVAVGILVVILLAAYSDHFQNSFHFDDAHAIVNNAAIQSLKNIPRFFTDARTFSSLPSNQSYRPLVSTLLAINYQLGGGNPFWFHLSIFALFLALIFLIAVVIQRLLDSLSPSPVNRFIALVAAALYGLHPANADTVNYIIASAEIISALGIVGSFAVYFAFPKARKYFLYVLPAALTILAKPPAAIFAVLFAIYRLLFRQETREPRRRTIAEIAAPSLICAVMLLSVQHMTPQSWISGARSAHNYLITQPYVALLYFKSFFWPHDLSADYDLDPLSSTNDPRFWAALLFIILLVTMSILCARLTCTRAIGFGLLWFVIALLPTSLFPLAEVMNDHRTFLPYIGLVIAMAGAAALLAARLDRQPSWMKIAATCAVVLFLCANGYATFQRNKVWKTEETLWHDVAIKSPGNGRGLMNYGNALMARGDYAGALDYFRRAEPLTPHYSVLMINIAIAEDATKQRARAEQHFKEALRLAPSSPDSY